MPEIYDSKDLVYLSEIPIFLRDERGMAKMPCRQTIWNWATKGIARKGSGRRLRLKVSKARGQLLTTKRWVDEFLASLDGAAE
jgi:hypothetical protein